MKRSAVRAPTVVPAAQSAVLESSPEVRVYDWRLYRPGALPLAFASGLAALSVIPLAQENARLWWSLWGAAAVLAAWDFGLLARAAAVLAAWDFGLLARAAARGTPLGIEIVLRRQHYLQACVQGSIFLYWGWYWREVYHSAPLILAQLLFAYAFDMLLVWSRRTTYTFGFGPFPVVLSINLFLWFRPDWFYLQFVLIALGFIAKESLRWNKDGRSAHVFNPSSFPLGVFALVLLVTGTTSLTYGAEIATTQFYPPHIYLFIFLCGLTGQYLFGVATMTLAAAATMYVFGLLYFWSTGVYYFFDTYIQIAVFIGMHLLFTDPATSPRTELGRIIFGVMYATGVILIYGLLGNLHAPTFYDKLLAVPIMNLMIQVVDRAARSPALRRFDPANLGRAWTPRRRNLVYMGLWASLFLVMSVTHAVGDTVPGHWLPFWQHACRDQRPYACANLSMMVSRYCDGGSGWACNEMGIRLAANHELAPARDMLLRACGGGFQPACDNGRRLDSGISPLLSADPQLADYGLLLREGKGPLPSLSEGELYARACSQGWSAGCATLERSSMR